MNLLGISSIVDSVGKVIGDLHTSDKERMELELEAKRIQALAQNAGAIQYMDAQTRMMNAEAAKITAQSIAQFKGGTLVLGGQSPVLNVGK